MAACSLQAMPDPGGLGGAGFNSMAAEVKADRPQPLFYIARKAADQRHCFRAKESLPFLVVLSDLQ